MTDITNKFYNLSFNTTDEVDVLLKLTDNYSFEPVLWETSYLQLSSVESNYLISLSIPEKLIFGY